MAVYKLRTILGHEFGATEEELKSHYNCWANGAINIASADKPLYYFSHFVLSDISFVDFCKIIMRG